MPISGRVTQHKAEDNPAQLSWTNLKNNYSQKGVQHTFNLSTQLHDIKMKQNETAIAFINRGIELRTLLKIAGKAIPDSNIGLCVVIHFHSVAVCRVIHTTQAPTDQVLIVNILV